MRLKKFPIKTEMKSQQSQRLERGFDRKKSDVGLYTQTVKQIRRNKKVQKQAYKKEPEDVEQIHIKLTTQNYMDKMNKYRAVRKKELMESDCPEILNLIHKMRTDEVHEAQQKLMTMINSVQAMNKIFDLIQNPKLEPWVKTIASTFLNRLICEKLEQYGYKSMFAAISNIMASYGVVPSDKRCFERSIISLIEYIRQPEEIDEWRGFILRLINDPLLFDAGILLISCTAISDIQVDYLCIVVEQTFEKTIQAMPLSLETAMIINQLVKNWIVVFDKLRIFTQEKTVESVEMIMLKICASESLAKLILSIYEFNAPKEIWLCVNPELYELNLLKYEAAELNKKIAQYALTTKIPASQCTCLRLIREYYNTIKNTVAVVSASEIEQIIQVYECEDFVISLISLLIIWVKSAHQHSDQEYKILLHLISYPFLKTREKEMHSFEDQPEEFNSLAEDLCDKQLYGILKSQAAKLLETISDHSKSALETVVAFSIECIKMRMGYIPMYQNMEVKILDIETAFQVLAICSFSLQNYPTHLDALKVILCDKRMMDSTPLEMSKIFLFLAYNYGEVFKNPFDGSFWIDYALNYKAHPTTRYMGLDFISNIVDEYFTQSFFNELVKLIIQGLPRQSGQIWNIIRKIFEAQMPKITQNLCLNLVNTVFLRIERQLEELQSKQKEQTINLINAIHVLRKIVEEKEYMAGKDALKSRVFDVAIIYNKAIEFNLEDEIIKIMIEYMKMNDEPTKEKMFQYLPAILEQFKKEGYHEKPYFILLNEIIVKSKFHTVKPILKTLLTGLMFHLFDMSETAKKSKMKVSIANILTLLQNLLSVHGFEMSGGESDCFCEIGSMAIRLFPQEGEKIFSKPLLAKALNLMFICHIYSKTQNTVDYLIQYANKNIFHKYDAFVLIKLLSKALFAQDKVNIVIEYLNLMIQISIEQEENSKKGNTAKNSKGKLKIKREQEMNELLYKITSPFIDFEYTKKNNNLPIKKEIIECVTKMKSNNLDTYKLIVMNMNEEQKSKLTRIMNETFQVEGKKRVIRKVVGARTQVQPLESEQVENENSDLQQEPESGNFKRQRVLMKRKEGKTKRDKINAQNQ